MESAGAASTGGTGMNFHPFLLFKQHRDVRQSPSVNRQKIIDNLSKNPSQPSARGGTGTGGR